MWQTLSVLPFPFWVVLLLVLGGCIWAVGQVRQGIGLPVLAVLVTITVWYVGDVLYNDYLETYMDAFPPEILTSAWWQVALFVAAFLVFTPQFHKRINGRYRGQVSRIVRIYKQGVADAHFQKMLTILFRSAFVVWIGLLVAAIFRFQGDLFYYFFPYLGGYAGPWTKNGVAQGGMDSLFVMASYLQLMVGAIFGVVAALSTNPKVRGLALLGVFLTWPYFIFDRTRKFILLIVLPGTVSWIVLRVRTQMIFKLPLLLVVYLLINSWFGFIVSHRSEFVITDALAEEGFDLTKGGKEKHQGLNMFEELSWIILFTGDKDWTVAWGQNYIANLVNPIPRFLWPGKPTIGLDYADARGLGGSEGGSGVYGTLSNGVIGQGIVNFGLYLGPAIAAMLASLWACWLARLDFNAHKIGYFPLYGLGLIMTFNLGRDITILELYPFLFGYVICKWLNRHSAQRPKVRRSGDSRKRRPSGPRRNPQGNPASEAAGAETPVSPPSYP